MTTTPTESPAAAQLRALDPDAPGTLDVPDELRPHYRAVDPDRRKLETYARSFAREEHDLRLWESTRQQLEARDRGQVYANAALGELSRYGKFLAGSVLADGTVRPSGAGLLLNDSAGNPEPEDRHFRLAAHRLRIELARKEAARVDAEDRADRRRAALMTCEACGQIDPTTKPLAAGGMSVHVLPVLAPAVEGKRLCQRCAAVTAQALLELEQVDGRPRRDRVTEFLVTAGAVTPPENQQQPEPSTRRGRRRRK